MRPRGTYDGDADAMATGRLHPDLLKKKNAFIYLICNLHAMRAPVDVPARPHEPSEKSISGGAATFNAQQVVFWGF